MMVVKYVPGPFVGQLSGSQGNTTASRNRSGSYLRNRVIPVNPNSPSQTSFRTVFTEFSQAWRGLTQGQRDGWDALAQLDPKLDVQGQSIVLQANAYYIGFNMDRNSVGLARLDNAPAMVEVPPAVTSAVLAISGGTPSIGYTPTVVDGTATNFQAIYATPQMSAGVNFAGRSDFRLITVIAGNAPVVPPEDLTAAYTAIFGTGWETSVGMRIAWRFKGVSDSGFVGDFTQQFEAIAA